jgi:aspartyl-tRNA(Asn)/glutamyl-tRNA(Gln) amidotransferase subunit A
VTIPETAALLRARKMSVAELIEQSLRAIEQENPRLNAFITITGDQALAQARILDDELARGIDRGPLHGIPIAHKDIFDTAGVRTTAGTKIFSGRVPKEDAEVVAQLAKAGCVMVGKTNLHELCYGITSTNPHYGAVHNPHDLTRIPGGSSGGSAAAVATGSVMLATGTDTGGSIRIPAAICGVVGFKPTYDRVSRRGVGPLGFTLDHVGPIAKSVHDAALCYSAMTGEPGPQPLHGGLRIGVPKTFFFDRVDPEIAKEVHATATTIEVEVPDIDAINAVGRLILLAETATVWRRHLNRREDFGADVLSAIEQGSKISAADYLDAQRLRRVFAKQFEQVWNHCDFLLTPATPTTAPKIGATTVEIDGISEDVRMASTRLVRPFNVLGWPALVIPRWTPGNSLPMGLQLVAPPNQDQKLLAAGMALER